MAGDETENYQRELADKNRGEKHSGLSHMLVKNMREQPQATKLVHSPRRPGKDVKNADEIENSKSYVKSMKLTNSSSSSSSHISCDNRQRRKSLQILQPSVDGQKLLVGGKSARKIKSPKQAKAVFHSKSKQSKLQLPRCSEDNNSPSSSSSSSEVESASTSENLADVQTSSNEAYSLMVQEPASETYWELVAEERRKALEETLQENQKLYQIIEELKAENTTLHEKANHTDYYATMYKISQDFDHKPEKPKDI